MTKKHFRALADKLHRIKAECSMTTGEKAWKIAYKAIADVCAEHNDRFDYERFNQACRGGLNAHRGIVLDV